jgi:hypothetical protein
MAAKQVYETPATALLEQRGVVFTDATAAGSPMGEPLAPLGAAACAALWGRSGPLREEASGLFARGQALPGQRSIRAC